MTPPESLSHPTHDAGDEPAARQAPLLRIVLAPNAFKGSLSAAEAADAMAAGVALAIADARVDSLPIADGGDGSVEAFVRAGFTAHPVITRGPTGAPVRATYATRADIAVVELADCCGMARLPEGALAPMDSSTSGLGDAIRAALDSAPRELVVCLGGSASTDGGAGMLVALGARLLDDTGHEIEPSGATLMRVAAIDVTSLDPRLGDTILVIAADVDSPLTGPHGAAAVFAPQKGADPAQTATLEAGLTRWGALLQATFGTAVADSPGAGAAGGTGAALLALGARLRPGFAQIAEAIGLSERLAGATVVITGEGRLDAQSALGKGVAGVAALAGPAGVPVLAVCGEIALPDHQARALGLTGWADLLSHATSPTQAQADARALLTRVTAEIVSDFRARPVD